MSSTKSQTSKNCQICRNQFYPRKDRENTNIFCSRKCFWVSEKGKPYNGAFQQWIENGGTSWNKGRHIALNDCLSKWRKKNPNASWNRGVFGIYKQTKETREKQRQAGIERVQKGLHNNYKGGITAINEKIRKSLEMKFWRESGFKRDDYTCQACRKRGGELQADHELPFALYPDLRFEILNGRTLCKPCHLKTPTWGFKSKNIYA